MLIKNMTARAGWVVKSILHLVIDKARSSSWESGSGNGDIDIESTIHIIGTLSCGYWY